MRKQSLGGEIERFDRRQDVREVASVRVKEQRLIRGSVKVSTPKSGR
jgi:hypothetical protein